MRRRKLWLGAGLALVVGGSAFYALYLRAQKVPGIEQLTENTTLVLKESMGSPAVHVMGTPGSAVPMTEPFIHTYTVQRPAPEVQAEARRLLSGPAWRRVAALSSPTDDTYHFQFVKRYPWQTAPGGRESVWVLIRPGKAVKVEVNKEVELKPVAEPWTTIVVTDEGRPLTFLERWTSFGGRKETPASAHAIAVMPAPTKPGGAPVWPF